MHKCTRQAYLFPCWAWKTFRETLCICRTQWAQKPWAPLRQRRHPNRPSKNERARSIVVFYLSGRLSFNHSRLWVEYDDSNDLLCLGQKRCQRKVLLQDAANLGLDSGHSKKKVKNGSWFTSVEFRLYLNVFQTQTGTRSFALELLFFLALRWPFIAADCFSRVSMRTQI